MHEEGIMLGVKSDSARETDILIADLQSYLQEHTDEVKIERTKESADAMDAGAILLAFFAAPAIVQLAKGIADWMRKRNVTVTISKDGKQQHLEGPPESVEKILRLLVERKSDAPEMKHKSKT